MEFWLSLILAGIGTGCIYALAGMGIVLTYKTTGVFNFGHGAIATGSAYLFFELYQRLGLPSVLAVLEADRNGGNFNPLHTATLGEWELPTDQAVSGSRTLTITVSQN